MLRTSLLFSSLFVNQIWLAHLVWTSSSFDIQTTRLCSSPLNKCAWTVWWHLPTLWNSVFGCTGFTTLERQAFLAARFWPWGPSDWFPATLRLFDWFPLSLDHCDWFSLTSHHSDWFPLSLDHSNWFPLALDYSDCFSVLHTSSSFLRVLGLWLSLLCSLGWNGILTHRVHMEIALFLSCLVSYRVWTHSENHEDGSQIKKWEC